MAEAIFGIAEGKMRQIRRTVRAGLLDMSYQSNVIRKDTANIISNTIFEVTNLREEITRFKSE